MKSRIFIIIAIGVVIFVAARTVRHAHLSAQISQSIIWHGTIRRELAGGEGLEIISSDSSGELFQAYMPQGEVSPITSGSVTIYGIQNGTTCSYGQECVPEVDIQSIERYE
jgi:hypothetical protein